MKAGTPPPHQIGSTSPPSPLKILMMTFFKILFKWGKEEGIESFSFIRGSDVCVEGGGSYCTIGSFLRMKGRGRDIWNPILLWNRILDPP